MPYLEPGHEHRRAGKLAHLSADKFPQYLSKDVKDTPEGPEAQQTKRVGICIKNPLNFKTFPYPQYPCLWSECEKTNMYRVGPCDYWFHSGHVDGILLVTVTSHGLPGYLHINQKPSISVQLHCCHKPSSHPTTLPHPTLYSIHAAVFITTDKTVIYVNSVQLQFICGSRNTIQIW